MVQKAILSATQVNSTVSPATLTGNTFTLAPGQSMLLSAVLIFTSAATTTGAALGVRVSQGAGANGNARGAAFATVALTSAAAASALQDGDVFNVAAGGVGLVSVLGTATVAGNNSAAAQANITNTSTNANTTVEVVFWSEVGGSAITAQIGSGAVVVVG